MTKNKNKVLAGGVAAIGAGVMAVGAGAYYFLGPKREQHQKEAKVWIKKMKVTAEKKLKEVKNINKKITK